MVNIYCNLPNIDFSFTTNWIPIERVLPRIQSGGTDHRDMIWVSSSPLRQRMAMVCFGPVGDSLEQRDQRSETQCSSVLPHVVTSDLNLLP